ncbi:glucosidase [Larkinella knui]|uniref:Glucosidase n=1 Tax=Larkinella knui TaxID=2025310 RepID=A0A3P1CKR0_9BACT|nr:glucosidase [Larkinella knui]RRB13656.1 glucosidase [Larkinella knui]
MTEFDKLKYSNTWRAWGPYVSDRQWGTVREDYSADGDAWNEVSHDMARSKTYRWGEEGIGGISDKEQFLCLALSLWNEQDSILKERLFGLTNRQGNHGEDVKELYYYLDNVPSHSYMKMLYKYPQQAFPYQELEEENQRRTRLDPEFELIDTGLFDQDAYFDVFIEYAKNDEHDILATYTVYNRGAEAAPLHLLPTLWFRNTLDWNEPDKKPVISVIDANTLILKTRNLGDYYCYAEGDVRFLFTENESNNRRLYNAPNTADYVKDGINNYVVNGEKDTVNPQQTGTKVSIHYPVTVPAKSGKVFKVRLTNKETEQPFADFDAIVATQKNNADAFYAARQKESATGDEKRVQRQAWAGMLWSKQFYYYNVNTWLKGDKGEIPPPESRETIRNADWKHVIAADVISMPDKWEYPWFAAWDLAFHCIALATIDPDFAKEQLLLLLQDRYMHPNGQLPAYEWNFSDVNPPVHALAAWKVYKADEALNGKPDTAFLQRVLHKLMLNFTWWVNRKDSEGNNIFEGGFLGLDNIGVFDRSAPLPGGGKLEQADGTSWMAMYSLTMMRIAMELALDNPVYEDLAIKYGEHFFYIAGSMANMGDVEGQGLWDEEDGFYYDMLRMPDGSWSRLRVRTLVGLIPLFAAQVVEDRKWGKLPRLESHMKWFMAQRPDLAALISNWQGQAGEDNMHLLSLLRGHRMKALLRRMLDENEFLSPYGIRSISKTYAAHPYDYWLEGEKFSVRYTPAESDSGMFGGNSNWRGPIWMPVNYLLVQALYRFHEYYGDDFKIELPTGSGQFSTIKEAAELISKRLNAIFLRDEKGRRAVFGENEKLQTDEHFKDYILFHEYFNGDTGKGLGASHQTGWTGLVAILD